MSEQCTLETGGKLIIEIVVKLNPEHLFVPTLHGGVAVFHAGVMMEELKNLKIMLLNQFRAQEIMEPVIMCICPWVKRFRLICQCCHFGIFLKRLGKCASTCETQWCHFLDRKFDTCHLLSKYNDICYCNNTCVIYFSNILLSYCTQDDFSNRNFNTIWEDHLAFNTNACTQYP